MDPISIALLLGGAVAGGAGGLMSRNDALQNAQAQADARNRVLASNIATQSGFGAANRGVFDANLTGYAPNAQTQQQAAAEASRAGTTVGNITSSDPASIPFGDTAPPAVRSELAKRMMSVHDLAVARGKATSKLGSFGDTWQQNDLANNEANRNIGVTNLYSAGRKALLGPEQEAASTAAYQPPSIWGTLLTGAGQVMGAAGGAGLGRGGGATPGLQSPRVPVPSVFG